MLIVDVTPEDKTDILRLFDQDKKIWPSGVGQNWYWFWRPHSTLERWVKVLTSDHQTIIGSAHWSCRRDGTRNLKDIIVDQHLRGQGIGKLLIAEIGRPIICKTDHDSEANHFYRALGFQAGEEVPSKNGAKLLRTYRLPVEDGAGPATGGS